ncbi:Fic family protein [Eubacteriales bacterium DFI.9.88]|nr:Fic family protein [Eubacteriales bacterium DFI.9.88]
MKELINVREISQKVETMFSDLRKYFDEPLIMEPFYTDFQYSFCWSSNAIEGNTLTLDDTISFLQYDEVRSGHTFSEYKDAKQLHKAIAAFLNFNSRNMDERWIQEINAVITDSEMGYRKKNVYIGTMAEAVYYPPDFEQIPELMLMFSKDLNFQAASLDEALRRSVLKHIDFERIHPFEDGNVTQRHSQKVA